MLPCSHFLGISMFQKFKAALEKRKALREHKKRRNDLFAKRKAVIAEEQPKFVLKKKEPFFLGMIFRFTDKRKREGRGGFSGWIVGGVTLVVAIFFFVLFGPLFRVKEVRVQITNHSLLDAAKVEEYLYQFQGKLLLFLHPRQMLFDIQSQFREVADVDCRKVYPNLIDCNVIEYKSALAVWRGEGEDTEYIVNEAGVIISSRKKVDDGKFIRVISSNKDMPIEIGSQVIEPQKIEFMYAAKNNFEDRFGLTVKSLWWLARERELHLYTDKNFPIYLSLERPLKDQLQALLTVFANHDFSGSTQYIDLRVKDKVFIK